MAHIHSFRIILGSWFLLCHLLAKGQEVQTWDAASIGRGKASVAETGRWATLNNPAGTAGQEEPTAGIFGLDHFLMPAMNWKGGLLTLPTSSGTFGTTFRSFGYSKYRENHWALTYGKYLSKQLSAGVDLGYHTVRIGEGYGHARAFTFGLGIRSTVGDHLVLAAHVANPNRSSWLRTEEKLPTFLKVGTSYRFSDDLRLNSEAALAFRTPVSFRVGTEYQVVPSCFLRVGFSTAPFLPSFGIGYQYHGFRLDAAASFHPVLSYNTAIALSYRSSR